MTLSPGPTIPEAEFETRRDLVRAAMAREGIDLFIAYSDDRAAFGPQHARYLFNYQPHFEPALSIIPKDDEALIATGPESDEFVLATSWCRTVRVVDAFAHADEEYPHTTISSLADLLTSLLRGGRVAVAGLGALPQRAWQVLRNATRAEIVDGDALIMRLRAVKSPAEIAVIREAYRIAEAGTVAALAVHRAGDERTRGRGRGRVRHAPPGQRGHGHRHHRRRGSRAHPRHPRADHAAADPGRSTTCC